MNEGWYGDEYLVLFTQAESDAAAARYSLARRLPGYVLVGLRFWDDFIVVSPAGTCLSLSTVPLDVARGQEFELPSAALCLRPDTRFNERVRWYVKPLMFGGEATPENTTWVTHEQHAELVCWWNDKYDSLKAS